MHGASDMFRERGCSMSRFQAWLDRTPSKRCDWIDQLRGWAVIVMIEVHCVNVWLPAAQRPEWLNYLNGLVAPSFLLAAGFSLTLSTFRPDGTLRPFWPGTAKRLGFILACAYALHTPGFTLAEWTLLTTPQRLRELFKIDVLQCIAYSLLILHLLARVLRRPRVFTFAALALALWISLVSPFLWAEGVGDGLWLPIRGLFNGNPDRGVQALFPLFPWFAFPAFGAFLGGMYRWLRVETAPDTRARTTEYAWLAGLAAAGLCMMLWGAHARKPWLWNGVWVQEGTVWRLHGAWGEWTWNELLRIQNATLPSILNRLGWVCMAGAAMGFIEKLRPRWKGPNPVLAASHESLLLYMLHLNLIFGFMLTPSFIARTGWGWETQGRLGTMLITATVIAINLGAGLLWQKIRATPERMRALQRGALAALVLWFFVGGWPTYRFFLHSPELAREPYPFLNAARARKGLPPTPDGLCRDPEEYFRAARYWKMPMDAGEQARARKLIEARHTEDTRR